MKHTKTNKTFRISEFINPSHKKNKSHKTTKYKKTKSIQSTQPITIQSITIQSILSSFYTIFNPISIHLIHYNDAFSKRIEKHALDNIHLCQNYRLLSMEDIFNRQGIVYKAQQSILADMKLKDIPSKVRQATEDFSRNLSKFISRRYQDKLPTHEITNAFIKIWECLSSFDLIPHRVNTKRFNIFHICEAPGQMILACKYFTEQKRKNITEYNWLANSLNPFNAEVKARYGNVFNDKYGLMRQHPKQWIWGADNTGDITQVKNMFFVNLVIY